MLALHIEKLPRISKFVYQKEVVSVCLEVYSARSENLEDQHITRKRWRIYAIKFQIVALLREKTQKEMISLPIMDNMYYDQEAGICYTKEEVDIHPLDAFFNLERYEGETSTRQFIRMVDIFQKVPSDIMPPRKELIRKFRELGISRKDPNLILLFQILDESTRYISPLDAYLNLEKKEDESTT